MPVDVKNILMILQSDYPPDIRVHKEMQALSAVGHQVFLLCNNKMNRQRVEQSEGITILRLKYFGSRWSQLVNIPLFFNPVWVMAAYKAIKEYNIDVIHVHDLPLVMSGVWLGWLFNIPVIFDVHENYPEAMRIWGYKGVIGFVIRNPWLAQKLENKCLNWADAIITVSEEHRELFLQRGLPEEKIIFVGNTVDYDSYSQMPIDAAIVDAYQKYYVLEYLGKFGPERDLETAIRGLSFLRREIPNVRLLLVGDGPNVADLLTCARQEGVEDLMQITGWVDFSKTASYIQACQICIVPQPSNPFIDNTIPHKIFQYMALKKPVVCSDAKSLARIIKETQCGEIFPSRSPLGFAKAVLKIYKGDFEYGQKGRQAVEKKYNWKISAQELISLYANLNHKANKKD